jgi:hypothetical protein
MQPTPALVNNLSLSDDRLVHERKSKTKIKIRKRIKSMSTSKSRTQFVVLPSRERVPVRRLHLISTEQPFGGIKASR